MYFKVQLNLYIFNVKYTKSVVTDIEVPTMDNVRSAALLGYKVTNYNHALCAGPTGTGKTVTVSSKLSRGLHKKFICEFIVFSARTSANQTQVGLSICMLIFYFDVLLVLSIYSFICWY